MQAHYKIDVFDKGLDPALDTLINDPQANRLLIACPYITNRGVDAIAKRINKRSIAAPQMRLLVITKFDLLDFICGASDLNAIIRLHNLARDECGTRLSSSAAYDLTPSLHAKIFLTNRQAIVGSANLTSSALYGGNAEICLKISEPSIRSAIEKSFIRLANQASAVDEVFLKQKQKQLQGLQSEKRDFEKIKKGVREYQAASLLRRLPVPQEGPLRQADYYGQMVLYLKWIRQGGNNRTQAGLRNKIAATLEGGNRERVAILRIEFLKAIKVIRFPTQNTVSLTSFGRDVANASQLKQKDVFKRILKWCEVEHHDRRLRDLMRPFAGLNRSNQYETIETLMEKMGFSDMAAFTASTSPARNWLRSLGVLEREGVPHRYKCGPNFPSGTDSIDEWINTIVGIENTLEWLSEGE